MGHPMRLCQKRYRDNQRNAKRNAKSDARNADTVTGDADRNATVTGDTVTRNAKAWWGVVSAHDTSTPCARSAGGGI